MSTPLQLHSVFVNCSVNVHPREKVAYQNRPYSPFLMPKALRCDFTDFCPLIIMMYLNTKHIIKIFCHGSFVKISFIWYEF